VPGLGQDEIFMLIGGRLSKLNHRNDTVFEPSDFLDDGADPYVTALELLELEGGADDGSLQGRPKAISGATIRVFRSDSIKAGIVNENSSRLDLLFSSGEPFTGDNYKRLPGGMGKECRIRVEHDSPGPLTLLGIYPEVTVHDR
jgi:hypothetical protein